MKNHLDKIYFFLTNGDDDIKKTAIFVISRLILNDYMKIKPDLFFNFVKLLMDESIQIKESV